MRVQRPDQSVRAPTFSELAVLNLAGALGAAWATTDAARRGAAAREALFATTTPREAARALRLSALRVCIFQNKVLPFLRARQDAWAGSLNKNQPGAGVSARIIQESAACPSPLFAFPAPPLAPHTRDARGGTVSQRGAEGSPRPGGPLRERGRGRGSL